MSPVPRRTGSGIRSVRWPRGLVVIQSVLPAAGVGSGWFAIESEGYAYCTLTASLGTNSKL